MHLTVMALCAHGDRTVQSLCGCKKGAYYGRLGRKVALVRLRDELVTWMVIPNNPGIRDVNCAQLTLEIHRDN